MCGFCGIFDPDGSADIDRDLVLQMTRLMAERGPDAEGQPRRIVLAGQDVDYRLFRARRRSIGMQISLAGLTVRAPRWVTIREIEATLTERGAWILR